MSRIESISQIQPGQKFIPINGAYADHVAIDSVYNSVPEKEIRFYPQGGGFVRKTDFDTFIQHFRPLEDADIPQEPVAAQFDIEGIEKVYSGYHFGDSWNGWAKPLFPLEEARRVLRDFVAGGDGSEVWGESDDQFAIINAKENELIEYPKETHSVNGETVVLAPIGAGDWVWDIVPE